MRNNLKSNVDKISDERTRADDADSMKTNVQEGRSLVAKRWRRLQCGACGTRKERDTHNTRNKRISLLGNVKARQDFSYLPRCHQQTTLGIYRRSWLSTSSLLFPMRLWRKWKQDGNFYLVSEEAVEISASRNEEYLTAYNLTLHHDNLSSSYLSSFQDVVDQDSPYLPFLLLTVDPLYCHFDPLHNKLCMFCHPVNSSRRSWSWLSISSLFCCSTTFDRYIFHFDPLSWQFVLIMPSSHFSNVSYLFKTCQC